MGDNYLKGLNRPQLLDYISCVHKRLRELEDDKGVAIHIRHINERLVTVLEDELAKATSMLCGKRDSKED